MAISWLAIALATIVVASALILGIRSVRGDGWRMGAGIALIVGGAGFALVHTAESVVVQKQISRSVERVLSEGDSTTVWHRLLDRTDLSPAQRTRAESGYASAVFIQSGERIDVRTETGSSVRYEPTKDDIKTRKALL